jgi:hypothetical protein
MDEAGNTGVITAVSAVLGLLTLITGFVILIIRGSRHSQKVESTVEHLLTSLTRHAEDKSIHTNDKLDDLKYKVLKEHLDEVKAGFNELRQDINRRLEELTRK